MKTLEEYDLKIFTDNIEDSAVGPDIYGFNETVNPVS